MLQKIGLPFFIGLDLFNMVYFKPVEGVFSYFFIDWQNWLGDEETLEPMMQQLHSFLLFLLL